MGEFKLTLEAARTNAHLTQSEAAEAAGISLSTMKNWESGKVKNIPVKKFRELCKIYNVPEQLIFLP